MVLLTAFVGGSLALVTTTASPARALCLAQPEEGTWRNIDPNTSGMTEARIESHCGDNVLCDENGNCTSDSGWYIRLRPLPPDGLRLGDRCRLSSGPAGTPTPGVKIRTPSEQDQTLRGASRLRRPPRLQNRVSAGFRGVPRRSRRCRWGGRAAVGWSG